MQIVICIWSNARSIYADYNMYMIQWYSIVITHKTSFIAEYFYILCVLCSFSIGILCIDLSYDTGVTRYIYLQLQLYCSTLMIFIIVCLCREILEKWFLGQQLSTSAGPRDWPDVNSTQQFTICHKLSESIQCKTKTTELYINNELLTIQWEKWG